MKKTIGIMAHVDAGKTTLSEQILYHARALRTPGRVDQASSFMDTDPIERRRGITIFSGQARFAYGSSEYILVDTPGHVDFSAEMERALSVLDAAVVVVSAAEGVQGHTEVILRLLQSRRIPTIIFINKLDRTGADKAAVINRLKEKLPGEVVDFSGRLADGIMEESLAEEIAALDEVLLEKYFEGEFDPDLWKKTAAGLVSERNLFPVFSGAALQGTGVDELLAGLESLVQTKYDEQKDKPFAARVYQVRHDARGSRILFLKVLAGTIRVKDELSGEKVDELRLYHGEKYTPADEVLPGELCAVTGISGFRPGQGIGSAAQGDGKALQPVLLARVLWEEYPDQQVLAAFRQLEDEDPELKVAWDSGLKQLTCHVMGPIQLEVLRQVVMDRFGLTISFGPCRIAYMETLTAPVVGMGHYEPLRHYAEGHLLLEPGPRGTGITFETDCPLEVLTENFQRLIRTHVFEKEHKGVLTGAPLTDVKITLLAGRSHLKHTEGGDFRQVVYRAIRHGLARGENLLLEPYYDFMITAPGECLGRIIADIQRMHGEFDPPQMNGEDVIIHGRGPVASFSNYGTELPASTQGRGQFTASYGGYEPCHNAEEVIAAAAYDMDADRENAADSVFCAKGAGFLVPWQEAAGYMHIDPAAYAPALKKAGLEPQNVR